MAFFFCISGRLLVAQSPLPDSFDPEANGYVYALVVQADGKIVVGGDFTMMGGQPCNLIARLNPDGTLDSGFNPGVVGVPPPQALYVDALAVQTDGKIILGGGGITSVGGQPRKCLARLNADGTLDNGFDPAVVGPAFPEVVFVDALAVQADGEIVVGGNFTELNGVTRNCLGRLNADGALDSSFNPAPDQWVASLALQADGKIVVGGWFTTLAGQPCKSLGRLNADGTLDTGFNPAPSDPVYVVALQADDKVLVGGRYATLAGQTTTKIVRLNPDGTLDFNFNTAADAWVESLAVQTDGKILAGGGFTTLDGLTPTDKIGRLNADGTLDNTFINLGAEWFAVMTVQPDGKILVGGGFTALGGQQRSGIARLNNPIPASQNLSYTGTTITWLRGGSSPEVWRTTFESLHNLNWISLGAGTRISGGWQLGGLSLSPGSLIRVRGYVAGGLGNASSWFVETTIGPPQFTAQLGSQIVFAGSTAIFSAMALGTAPLSYQWLKNGTNLTDHDNVSGATTDTLKLANVQAADAGIYSVSVINVVNSTNNGPVTLTVLPPLTITRPVLKGPGFVFGGVGGIADRTYYVLTSTNVGAQLTDWVRVLTNTFAVDGSFSITNAVDKTKGSGFFRLLVP